MKRISLSLFFVMMCIIILALSCQNSNAGMMKEVANYTTASFPDSIQNFGTLEQGKEMKIVFHVLNNGNKPLLIADAKPSCGCTVANFTKSAIAPGKEGEITGTFNSNYGMPGQLRKTITVTTNTSPTHNMLIFMGDVAPKTNSLKTK